MKAKMKPLMWWNEFKLIEWLNGGFQLYSTIIWGANRDQNGIRHLDIGIAPY